MMRENLDLATDEQISHALQVIRNQEAQQNKKLLVGTSNIRLVFSVFKIPNTSKNQQLLKVVLPHQPHNEDVCLFVGDGRKGRGDRGVIDDTINKFEEKISKYGVQQIKEVIPLLKLKLEYQTFESRRALATRFDSFLADDKIMRFLPTYLGKAFYDMKKYPIQVRLGEQCMERELRKGVQTSICPITYKGNSHSMVVGTLDMKDGEVVENIRTAMQKIAGSCPGGPDNLQSFQICLDQLPSLPLFISTVDRSTIPVPKRLKPPSNRPKNLIEEISTIKGRVKVGADGTVTVYKKDGSVRQVIGGKEPTKKSLKRSREMPESSEAEVKKAKKLKAVESVEEAIDAEQADASMSPVLQVGNREASLVGQKKAAQPKSTATPKHKTPASAKKRKSIVPHSSEVKKLPAVRKAPNSATEVNTIDTPKPNRVKTPKPATATPGSATNPKLNTKIKLITPKSTEVSLSMEPSVKKTPKATAAKGNTAATPTSHLAKTPKPVSAKKPKSTVASGSKMQPSASPRQSSEVSESLDAVLTLAKTPKTGTKENKENAAAAANLAKAQKPATPGSSKNSASSEIAEPKSVGQARASGTPKPTASPVPSAAPKSTAKTKSGRKPKSPKAPVIVTPPGSKRVLRSKTHTNK